MAAPFTVREAFALGRVFTYQLNARVDARIASALMHHARYGSLPPCLPEVAERAGRFLRGVPHGPDTHARLVAIAFTLERANGLADSLWADVVRDLRLRRRRVPVNTFVAAHVGDPPGWVPPYAEDPASIPAILGVAARLLLDLPDDHERFQRRHGVAAPIGSRELARMVCLVQRTNIARNRSAARAIEQGAPTSSVRVALMRHAAASCGHTARFLRAAAVTQRAAARWDMVFMALLRLRYWV